MVYDTILNFLSAYRNSSHSISDIYKHVKCDKKLANRCLYQMLNKGLVIKTKESNPPSWQYKNGDVTKWQNRNGDIIEYKTNYDKILNFLATHPTLSYSITDIYNHAKCNKKLANRCLYEMLNKGLVRKIKESDPPTWQYKN